VRRILSCPTILLLLSFAVARAQFPGPAVGLPTPTSTPAIVQSLTSHGVSSMNTTGDPQICTWTLSQPIAAGDTVVGYTHMSSNSDTAATYFNPGAITDNAGNAYNISSPVDWTSFPEDIQIFYLTNVNGPVSTLTFNLSNWSSSHNNIGFCDVGWTEYKNVNNIVIVNPSLIPSSNTSPSLTITPTAPSLIWAFASPFVEQYNPSQTLILPSSGYSVIINNDGDNIDVWGSNSLISTSQTLTWNSNNTGSFGNTDTVVMGAAVSAAP